MDTKNLKMVCDLETGMCFTDEQEKVETATSDEQSIESLTPVNLSLKKAKEAHSPEIDTKKES